jgi:hypothetical protein
MSALEIFIKDYCHYVPGSRVLLSDFVKKFHTSIPEVERSQWTSIMVGKKLRNHPTFPKGNGFENQVTVINMSWEPDTPPRPKLKIKDGKVVEE